MAFSLQSYPSATSYFLLLETKIIYEMRVSHFVSKRLFLTYYILPTETTLLLKCSFSSVPFQKEILEREWKKRKETHFRKNALTYLEL